MTATQLANQTGLVGATDDAQAADGAAAAIGSRAWSSVERVRRLAMPHFAHLRGVLQGLDPVVSARRFLGAATTEDARQAHEDVLSAARALASRVLASERGSGGLRAADLPLLFATDASVPVVVTPAPAPDAFEQALQDWAEAKGLDTEEWDRDDLVAHFIDEHPQHAAVPATAEATLAPPGAARVLGQAGTRDDDGADTQDSLLERLRRQMTALQALEQLVAVAPQGSHPIAEWFDALTAGRLLRAGMLRLDELQRRVADDVRWYRNVVAIGVRKARAIEAYLAQLLPVLPRNLPPAPTRFVVVDQLLDVVAEAQATTTLLTPSTPWANDATSTRAGLAEVQDVGHIGQGDLVDLQVPVPAEIVAAAEAAMPSKLRASLAEAGLDGRRGLLRLPYCTGRLRARNDLEAIVSWVRAKAGSVDADNYSPTTARTYLQHALRLMLWCVGVRRIAVSSMQSEDCEAYMAWLADIPAEWIGRGRAKRWEPGWRPFSSQLSRASRQHAIRVAAALSGWMCRRGYISTHPWEDVKLRLGDDPGAAGRSRAFTHEAWSAIVAYVEQPLVLGEQVSPERRAELEADRQRMLFVLQFNEAMGLRGTELATTVLGDFVYSGAQRWKVTVHGKGQKTADVRCSPQALRSLQRYLEFRGLKPLGEAPPSMPLLARVDHPTKPIGYQALAASFRAWVRRAMDASTLPAPERELAMHATTHWLRHTMATTADERGVSRSALREQLRHKDSRTTDGYVHPRVERVAAEFEEAFR